VFGQGNNIPDQGGLTDTGDVRTLILGELSITETLGGRISGSSFSIPMEQNK
jgi:hypothetical protein